MLGRRFGFRVEKKFWFRVGFWKIFHADFGSKKARISSNPAYSWYSYENFKSFIIFLGCNRIFLVNAENSFNKPRNNFNYFLYYFEVKCKFEGKLENKDGRRLVIGLKNLNKNRDIFYCANESTIFIERSDSVELETYFNNNDIFGCGLVYPPINRLDEFPYIFFTQNGKQIGNKLKNILALFWIIRPPPSLVLSIS
ncbi:unnamed protein product [Meloidogyne enterolobii]|uniref:Uncharacterized protein n=1 Tax=Meloidogyne enterolobii TaxID=390850 RepID=A0ACB0YW29_MELEN